MALICAMTASAGAARAGGLETYGDITRFALPGLAALISAAKEDKKGLFQLSAAVVVSYGVIFGLKRAVDSTRPNGGKYSFPSGHMTNAMAGASYLHYRYGWKYGLPAYAAASVVGIARIKGNFHRWEDILGAAVVANLTAYLMTDKLNNSITLMPVFDARKKNFGLLAIMRF